MGKVPDSFEIVACPVCKAQSGQVCRGAFTGEPKVEPHLDRIIAAQKAAQSDESGVLAW